MKLIELYAEEFGCLSERRFSFGEGLHVIEGPNESGKSTLLALLRFLFYGFGRRGAEEIEERARRLSRKGHRAAGRVIFLWQGREVVLCRDLVVHTTGGRETPTEHVQVYLRQTGEPIELGTLSAGEYFLGLPLALYHSSACVRQSELDGISGEQTGDAVSEFLFLGAGGARLERAARALDEARRALQHHRGTGGKIPMLEAERNALAEAYDAAQEKAARAYEIGVEKQSLQNELDAAVCELAALRERQEAAHLSLTLKRYDEWEAACEEEKQAELAWHATEQTVSERFPTEQAMERASAALGEYSAAAARHAACHGEAEAAKGELSRHAPTVPQRAVLEAGGTAAVKGRMTAWQKQARICGGAALLSAVLLLLFALGAVLLPAVRAVLGVGSGVLLLLSLLLLLLRKRAKRKQATLLAVLGLPSANLLRTFLSGCEESFAQWQVYQERLSRAKEYVCEAKAREDEALLALQKACAAIGIAFTMAQEARTLLASLQARCREARVRVDAAKTAYERAQSARMALENGLDPAALPALRAAYAALPAQGSAQAGGATFGELEEKINAYRNRLRALEREEAERLAGGASPVALREELMRVQAKIEAANQRLAAVTMAAKALEAADATLREGVLPSLAARASDILERLTGGIYGRLHMSGDFVAFLETDEGLFPLSHSSAGARDVAYLALRLGLLEMITREPLPLLLDEVCARLDDTRAACVLRFLDGYCKSGGQCLLFTCHTREARLLAGSSYRHIHL